MRVVFAVLLALLFAAHTAYAAAPQPQDCCEEMCAGMDCLAASCGGCQAVAAHGEPAALRATRPTPCTAAHADTVLRHGIDSIWRPPWTMG